MMTVNTDMLEGLIWDAIHASVKAGEAILKVYNTDFKVNSKADDSPLTKADMEAHAIISGALAASGLPLLSEEGREIPYSERKGWQKFWMVDPLDGTREFVNRNGEFTVNIALIEGGYPLAGVIYIPVEDVLYFGSPGSGSMKFEGISNILESAMNYKDLIPHGVMLPLKKKERPYTVVCSRSHMSKATGDFIDELKQEHGRLEYASRGSSLKICMVAEGSADIYPRFAPTMEWDTAAGQAIAESSGASVTAVADGERMRYNKEDLKNPWFIVKQ